MPRYSSVPWPSRLTTEKTLGHGWSMASLKSLLFRKSICSGGLQSVSTQLHQSSDAAIVSTPHQFVKLVNHRGMMSHSTPPITVIAVPMAMQ